MEPFGVVYMILNLVNGKKYVGQTVKPLKRRFNEHARSRKSLISKAIRKYGKEKFYCGVIVSCSSKEEMDEKEKFYIATLHSKSPFGYNRTDGGEGTSGIERTPEHRAKLSAAMSGEKNPHYGKKNTPEHQAKIIAANLGRKRKPGTGENIAAALRGKPFTKKRCANISAAKRGDSPYKNLVAELDAHNLSYAALARLIGSVPNVLSRKMNCVRNFTDADKDKLAEIFGKSAEYLLQHETATEIEQTKPGYSPYKNLIAELDAHNISCKAFAKLLGLARKTVAEKMNGIYNFTDADKAKLEEIFGKSVEYLLQRETGTETEALVIKKRSPLSQEDCAKRSIRQRGYSPYKNLLAELDAHQLSYRALEKLMGVARLTIARKMRGEYNFTERDKTNLTEIFGKPIEFLLQRSEQ